MMIDKERLRKSITEWFQAHPDDAQAARDDFDDKAWFKRLASAVYPSLMTRSISEAISNIAREFILEDRIEGRLARRLRLLEQITEPQFEDAELKDDLQVVLFDDMEGGRGKAITIFGSKPLTVEDKNKLRKREWMTEDDFNRDFPDAFGRASAQSTDAARMMQPVRVISPENAENLADPKKATVEFGGGWVQMDEFGRDKAYMRLNVYMPLTSVADAELQTAMAQRS